MAVYLRCAECGRYIYMGEGFYQVGWKAYCTNCCKKRHMLFDEWEKKLGGNHGEE